MVYFILILVGFVLFPVIAFFILKNNPDIVTRILQKFFPAG